MELGSLSLSDSARSMSDRVAWSVKDAEMMGSSTCVAGGLEWVGERCKPTFDFGRWFFGDVSEWTVQQ